MESDMESLAVSVIVGVLFLVVVLNVYDGIYSLFEWWFEHETL